MSESYVGRVCRRRFPRVCRTVCRKSGADGCGQGILQLPCACLLRGPSPRRSLGTLAPPKDGTKPQCFALRRSGLEPSREWGPGYVGGMSEVCRTRGLWVSPLFRALSREWGLEPCMEPLRKSGLEPRMGPRVCRKYVGSLSDTWTLGLTSVR